MAATGANAPPLGTVIQGQDGATSMWNGKSWVPAAQQQDGSWAVDGAKMASMGLGNAGLPLSATDQKTVKDISDGAASMDQAASTTGDFMIRNGRTKTGGLLGVPVVGTIAKALGAGGDDLAAMDRDSTSLATSLRAPGQRLTQMEWLQNIRSGPSTKNAEPDNVQAADAIYKANTLAQAKASFYSGFLNAHRTLAGVIPAWQAWKSQHFAADGSYSHDPITHSQAAGMALRNRAVPPGAPGVLKPTDYLGGP